MSAAGMENSVVSSRLTYRPTDIKDHTFEFMSVCLSAYTANPHANSLILI